MKTVEKKQPTEKQLSAIRAKREELKALSNPFKVLLKEGAIDTINEGLVAMYAEEGHRNLKTLKQWNKEGKQVIKGEHACLIWGTPKKINRGEQPEQATEPTEENEDNFFPICFLFSEKQVQERRTA